MKKKLYLFSVLLIMLGALFQLNAQEDTIIFVAPYDAAHPYVYSDATNREVENVEFLERQGFKVIRFWPAKAISLVGQDTIDMLNAADLVIIGRSGPSTSFQQVADRKVWNALTAPQLLICQWKARSSRLQYFNSTDAIHRDTGPAVAYATATEPDDTIFSYVTLKDDMVGWCYPAHDFIRQRDSTKTNGDILATFEDTIVLVARWDAGQFYPGSDTAGGPRSYFGMGNDNTQNRLGRFSNFFPLTKEAKKAYLGEICRLLGKPVQEPVWGAKDIHITFVAPYDAVNPYTYSDATNREVENVIFLENQGFKVDRFWPIRAINLTSKDSIDMLNTADLVIIGRSGPSTSFQQVADRKVWNALTSPQLLICQWKARSSRLQYFNSGDAIHRDTGPAVAYATATTPVDDIFSGVTLVGDSMGWCYPAHDFIRLRDSTKTNGDILATFEDTIVLVARWDAGQFYPGSDTAGGLRSYFGMGNDNTQTRYKVRFSNFFPLTREAKQVYLAEISRLVGVDAPDITYSAADYKITFVAPYDATDVTVNREIPQIKFLEKNGFKVKEFWPIRAINLTPQDSIDMLNAADLVIIGRSGPSTSFQAVADRKVWNALTSPQMLICQWKARSSRLQWFNSTDAIHRNDDPLTVYGHIEVPLDAVFSNVTLAGDSMQWFTPPPHDFIRGRDTTTVNGDVLATFEDTIVLMARFDADVAFYPGSDTAGGPRSYFGIGNDAVNVGGKQFSNFFPLHDKAQQVYFNELCHMLDIGVSKVVTVSGNADLMDITFDAPGELSPAFNADTMMYTLVLTDTNVVNIDAVLSSDLATVVGDSSVTVASPAEPVTIYLLVTAENGVRQAYELTIQLFHTSVQEIHSDATLRIYPNPATDMLNISSENTINKVTIYNVLGKVVIDETYRNNNQIQLNVSSLKPGLYLIKVGEGKDAIMGKFLIQ